MIQRISGFGFILALCMALGATSTVSWAETVAGAETQSGKKPVSTAAKNKTAQHSRKAEAEYDFKHLDQESETLLKEILDLSSDLAIIEERQNNPAKFQLLVLVTMKPTDLFKLDYMELRIDDQTVAAYNYTSSDHQALQLGGAHRLYLANLPAGMHKLYANMAGRVPRDPDYKSDVRHSFISGVARTVLELEVSAAETRGFPKLHVIERN